MSTALDNCNIHESHDHSHSLIDRVWSRLTQGSSNRAITSDHSIKQAVLEEQKQLQLQNQARRTADIHRLVMRHIL